MPRTPRAPCPNILTVPDQEMPPLAELVTGEEMLEPLPAPMETYQLLDAPTCQCNAATNVTVANMVELERHWAKVIIECDSATVRENLCLDRDLLALHAAGIRNEAAGSALQAFYQLAGLELQEKYLQLGYDEALQTHQRLEQLQEKGLSVPQEIEPSQVASRLSDLEDQKAQLEFTRIQLNGQLQKLIGCPMDEYSFYWPMLDWSPELTPLDIEGAVALGLDTRSDLRGLELLLCQLEKATLPVARGVLRFADSTVGSIEPLEGLVHRARCLRCNKAEVPIRCRQLALFYEDTRRSAIAEIKNAAYQISLQQQRVVVARQKIQKLQDRLRELEEMRDIEDISIFQISRIRGDLYDAEASLVEQLVALKLAQVQLRQAQGMLAVECGCSPKLCLEGCPCDGACMECLSNGSNVCGATRTLVNPCGVSADGSVDTCCE